jgi:hypothetical protein
MFSLLINVDNHGRRLRGATGAEEKQFSVQELSPTHGKVVKMYSGGVV